MRPFPAITELVPHSTPMLAVEELVAFEVGCARTRLVVRPEGLFVREGRVDGVLALEYMAQGVAACLGMESYVSGGGVRVGMVIACRRMELERPSFALGEELLVEARRVRGNDFSSHFETELHDASGARVASATMTLVHGA